MEEYSLDKIILDDGKLADIRQGMYVQTKPSPTYEDSYNICRKKENIEK